MDEVVAGLAGGWPAGQAPAHYSRRVNMKLTYRPSSSRFALSAGYMPWRAIKLGRIVIGSRSPINHRRGLTIAIRRNGSLRLPKP